MFTEGGGTMAAARKGKKRTRASLFTKVLLVVLLAALGVQLRVLHGQVQEAQAEKDQLAQQVQLQQQENDALSQDIAEGNTREKMLEIAREELGYVEPNEIVIYDVSN